MLVEAALLRVVLVEAAMVGLVGAALVGAVLDVVGAALMGEVLVGDKMGESPEGSSALSYLDKGLTLNANAINLTFNNISDKCIRIHLNTHELMQSFIWIQINY